jgi:hypothetical protein
VILLCFVSTACILVRWEQSCYTGTDRHDEANSGSRVVTWGRTDMMKLTVGAELLHGDGQT